MTTLIVAKPADVAVVTGLLNRSLGDKPLQVVITEYVENRRRRQENCYRAWCRLIASETGNDPEAIHKYLAKKFLGTEIISVEFKWKGKSVKKESEDIKSTTKLSMKEMSLYLEQVRQFSIETLGIILPDSNDG